MKKELTVDPSLRILPVESSLIAVSQVTRKRPLTTLKILRMQNSIKQNSQAEVNLKHTWVAFLQTLHDAIPHSLQTSKSPRTQPTSLLLLLFLKRVTILPRGCSQSPQLM